MHTHFQLEAQCDMQTVYTHTPVNLIHWNYDDECRWLTSQEPFEIFGKFISHFRHIINLQPVWSGKFNGVLFIQLCAIHWLLCVHFHTPFNYCDWCSANVEKSGNACKWLLFFRLDVHMLFSTLLLVFFARCFFFSFFFFSAASSSCGYFVQVKFLLFTSYFFDEFCMPSNRKRKELYKVFLHFSKENWNWMEERSRRRWKKKRPLVHMHIEKWRKGHSHTQTTLHQRLAYSLTQL